MNIGWLTAWWNQIRRVPPADPWNDDPDILQERDRQHNEGVTDAALAYRLRRQLDGMAIRRERQFWSKHGGHGKAST